MHIIVKINRSKAFFAVEVQKQPKALNELSDGSFSQFNNKPLWTSLLCTRIILHLYASNKKICIFFLT